MTVLIKSLQTGALAAALLLSPLAWAQNANTSAAKKELIGRVLKLQQQAIENMAVGLLQQPLAGLAQAARVELAKMPADKREAAGKAIDADFKKFADENMPVVVEQANRLTPGTLGVMLDDRFNEEELKQLLTWLESPVNRKYVQLAGEFPKAFGDKLEAEVGKQMSERIKALQQATAKNLGIQPAAPAATKPATPKK